MTRRTLIDLEAQDLGEPIARPSHEHLATNGHESRCQHRRHTASLASQHQSRQGGACHITMRFGGTTPLGSSRYRRVRALGRGSFGEVFEAEDTLLGRRVAVKILPFADHIPILARRALLSEAQMAAAAGRSAVQVYDLVETDSGSWLVMECIDGGPLSAWASEARAESELRTVTRSMADRLAVLHDLGLIHGDIHPRNILVRATDDVALSDFGLARMAGESSRKSGAHERHWSAPEVLASGRISTAADVYSLAKVTDWLYRKASLTPPSATAMGMAVDPERRPRDGSAFAALLDDSAAAPGASGGDPLASTLRSAAEAARLGRTQEAERILEAAIREAPLDPRPRRRLALVRWASGQRQAAIWALESARHLDPRDRSSATILRNWRDALEGGR